MKVRSWGYRCELTLPQIELMSSDLPHTLYKKIGEKKGAKSKDIEDAERLMLEARERKRKRMEKGKESYTIKEIFDGAIEQETE